MNSTQENKVSMYFKVELFFTNHFADLTPAVAKLTLVKSQFAANLVTLAEYQEEANEDNSGYAIQKQDLRNSIRDKVLVISGGAVAYALMTNNKPLAAKFRFTKSTLDGYRDTDFLFKVDKFYKIVNEMLAEFSQYGVLPATASALEAELDIFRASIENPDEQRSENRAYREAFEKLMDGMDAQLELMDNLMATFAISKPILYNQYKFDRLIDDNASGGATPPDIEITIAPGTFEHVLTYPYLAGRSFKAKNLGADQILWGLSTLDTEFTNPSSTLDGGSTSTKLSSTLGPDGDILLFQNPSANPISIEVTVLE